MCIHSYGIFLLRINNAGKICVRKSVNKFSTYFCKFKCYKFEIFNTYYVYCLCYTSQFKLKTYKTLKLVSQTSSFSTFGIAITSNKIMFI